MRNIKAKALRRLARRQTIGQPECAYTGRTGTVHVHPNSTRGRYRILKKLWKSGNATQRRKILAL